MTGATPYRIMGRVWNDAYEYGWMHTQYCSRQRAFLALDLRDGRLLASCTTREAAAAGERLLSL